VSFEESKELNRVIMTSVDLYLILSNTKSGEFEKSIGKHPGYLARICNTGAEISLLTVKKIAEVLDTSIDNLMNGAYREEAEKAQIRNRISELLSQKEMIEKEIEALRNGS